MQLNFPTVNKTKSGIYGHNDVLLCSSIHNGSILTINHGVLYDDTGGYGPVCGCLFQVASEQTRDRVVDW